MIWTIGLKIGICCCGRDCQHWCSLWQQSLLVIEVLFEWLIYESTTGCPAQNTKLSKQYPKFLAHQIQFLRAYTEYNSAAYLGFLARVPRNWQIPGAVFVGIACLKSRGFDVTMLNFDNWVLFGILIIEGTDKLHWKKRGKKKFDILRGNMKR